MKTLITNKEEAKTIALLWCIAYIIGKNIFTESISLFLKFFLLLAIGYLFWFFRNDKGKMLFPVVIGLLCAI